MKAYIKNIFYDIGIIIISSVLFSASVNMFIIPGNIVLGGATGIATVVGRLFSVPVGVLIIAVNVPLVLINAKLYGSKFIIKTAIGIAATSAATDLLTFFPVTISDPILCALFGGVAMGAGTGLLFTRGYTTGGTDLVCWIIRSKWQKFSSGRIIMICDFIIISALTIVLGNYIGIIYSLISTYAFSTTVDVMIDGASRAKSVFIISERHREIAERITVEMGRGVTVLFGRGYYTNKEKSVLMCVVKKNELFAVRRIIEICDPGAFVFFNDTSDVLGMGFEKE